MLQWKSYADCRSDEIASESALMIRSSFHRIPLGKYCVQIIIQIALQPNLKNSKSRKISHPNSSMLWDFLSQTFLFPLYPAWKTQHHPNPMRTKPHSTDCSPFLFWFRVQYTNNVCQRFKLWALGKIKRLFRDWNIWEPTYWFCCSCFIVVVVVWELGGLKHWSAFKLSALTNLW